MATVLFTRVSSTETGSKQEELVRATSAVTALASSCLLPPLADASSGARHHLVGSKEVKRSEFLQKAKPEERVQLAPYQVCDSSKQFWRDSSGEQHC